MEIKTVPLEFKAAAQAGAFKGYGAIFGNRDDGGDIIEQGAFKKFKTTKDGKVRIALYHDLDKIIGKATVTQDTKGLLLDGQLNLNLSYASDAYELMKDGSLDGLSVGFNIIKGGSEWKEDGDDFTRIISKAELWEVSVVPFGMNPKAKVSSVKAADLESITDIRDLEDALRDAGFSRKQAVAIALHGFKGLQRDAAGSTGAQRDADDQSSAMLDQLKSHITDILKAG